MLSSASEAAQRILDEITARVFSGVDLRAGDVEREVQSLVELSNRAMGLARSNWELGEGVRVRLGRVGGLLVSANTLAAETVGVASRAIGSVGEAQEILMVSHTLTASHPHTLTAIVYTVPLHTLTPSLTGSAGGSQ